MNQTDFSSLSLSKEMLFNLKKMGYKSMTPIQSKTLPYILNKTDVIAQAKTGSGKTAAFGIGLLQNLDVKRFRIQSLVLCPTRELANQVAKELRDIAKFAHNIKILTLCGGSAFYPQVNSLKHNAHIVVGTPGRVLKHLDKESLNLQNMKTLVLDEADRMLDMGFIEEIQKILSYAPKERQTLLFSATYPDEIITLSNSIQKDAINIKTTDTESANKIAQYFYKVESLQKFQTLLDIFATFKPQNAIVFCNTKIGSDELAQKLQDKNIDALAIHGDLEQYERNDVLVQFSNKSCRVLIATDVAARGLDIKELSAVINYDIPHTKETYTHRIGRTARAGKEGLAFTLYTNNEEENIDQYKNDKVSFHDTTTLKRVNDFKMTPPYTTLVIEGGKKDKLSKGDLLGALTGDVGLEGKVIGQIDIYERQSYVAIENAFIDEAYKKLSKGKIKAKRFPLWIL
jgi:ATP-independent RNA helicase DbpA